MVSNSLFIQQRYFVLTPEKLTWYSSHQKAKPIGCVNLKLLKIDLISKND